MKKVTMMKGWALGLMLIFVTTTTFAGEGIKAVSNVSVLPYLDSDYSIISVSNLGDRPANFSIKDTEGVTVYSDWVNKAGFEEKILNFSNLEDGEYTAILKPRKAEAITKTFKVIDQKLAIERAPKDTNKELRAFFNLVDDILFVSHISYGSKTVGISISDAIGEEIFEKGLEGNSTYSGKFDLSELSRGDYKISINSGNKEYSYAFKK